MSKRTATRRITTRSFKNSHAILEELEAAFAGIPEEWILQEMAVWSWPDTPEGALWYEMSDTLEVFLKDVGLDAKDRKFLWPDAQRLDLNKTVRRINKQYPKFPKRSIKEFLIFWIRELYVPDGYSQSQMDELETLTERWVEDVNPGKN